MRGPSRLEVTAGFGPVEVEFEMAVAAVVTATVVTAAVVVVDVVVVVVSGGGWRGQIEFETYPNPIRIKVESKRNRIHMANMMLMINGISETWRVVTAAMVMAIIGGISIRM